MTELLQQLARRYDQLLSRFIDEEGYEDWSEYETVMRELVSANKGTLLECTTRRMRISVGDKLFNFVPTSKNIKVVEV